MEIQTSELIGQPLDWAVARCKGAEFGALTGEMLKLRISQGVRPPAHSTDWAPGGQIIELEKIRFNDLPDNGIRAFIRKPRGQTILMDCWDEGITPLMAAMRCYVASKLGPVVDVPEELA